MQEKLSSYLVTCYLVLKTLNSVLYIVRLSKLMENLGENEKGRGGVVCWDGIDFPIAQAHRVRNAESYVWFVDESRQWQSSPSQ